MKGLRVSLPVCLGVIPVGISFGLLAVQAGFNGLQAVAMSVFVMAGSSQIMAVGMLGQGAAVASIIAATFFLNLRHIVMSTSIMGRLRGVPVLQKLVGAFAICDESFAIFSLSEQQSFPFLLGANTALYGTWVISSAIGCLADCVLPELAAKSFGIAFYAAFLAMLLPSVKKNTPLLLLAALSAGLHTLLRCWLPGSWAAIFAMIAGAAIGTILVPESNDQRGGATDEQS